MALRDKETPSLACIGDEVRLLRATTLKSGRALPKGMRGRVVSRGLFTVTVNVGGDFEFLVDPELIELAPSGRDDVNRASRVTLSSGVRVQTDALAALVRLAGAEGAEVAREALGPGTVAGLERRLRCC